MSSFGVTESLKRYYEAIEELEDELKDPDDNSLKNSISQVDVANVVGVVKSTASEQLKKLDHLGFVEDIGVGQRKNYRIASN
jgi:predicted transcriptional regulator